MNTWNKIKAMYIRYKAIIWYFATVIMIATTMSFTSCKTVEYVPVEKVHDVYHNTTDTLRDSIYHDVFVKEYIKGDTVYNIRTELLYKDRWHHQTDTLLVRDTVTNIVQVEKHLTAWQNVKMQWFVPLLIAVLISGFLLLFTFIKKFFS